MEKPEDDIDDVIVAMVQARDKLPGFEQTVFLYFICGGAMKMAYGAGQVRALHQLGFGEIAKYLVAISSGSAVAAYFLAGWKQIEDGCLLLARIIPQYIHPGIKNIGQIIDADGIESELRVGGYALDVGKVRKSLTQFFVGVMDRKTGQYLIRNVFDGDPITWMKAAMNMIWVARGKVIVDGKEYCDGGAYVADLKATIEQLDEKPTHVLILPNNAAEAWPPQGLVMKLYSQFTYWLYPNRKEQIKASRFENITMQIDWCRENGILRLRFYGQKR